jgi:hypothetical protein
VLKVERGHYSLPTVDLVWQLCEFHNVRVGARFRIEIHRNLDPPEPEATRYRVRDWTAVTKRAASKRAP